MIKNQSHCVKQAYRKIERFQRHPSHGKQLMSRYRKLILASYHKTSKQDRKKKVDKNEFCRH